VQKIAKQLVIGCLRKKKTGLEKKRKELGKPPDWTKKRTPAVGPAFTCKDSNMEGEGRKPEKSKKPGSPVGGLKKKKKRRAEETVRVCPALTWVGNKTRPNLKCHPPLDGDLNWVRYRDQEESVPGARQAFLWC